MKVLTNLFNIVLALLESPNSCEHKNTHTYVEEVTVTCEKIKVTCLNCKKVLLNLTDCR